MNIWQKAKSGWHLLISWGDWLNLILQSGGHLFRSFCYSQYFYHPGTWPVQYIFPLWIVKSLLPLPAGFKTSFCDWGTFHGHLQTSCRDSSCGNWILTFWICSSRFDAKVTLQHGNSNQYYSQFLLPLPSINSQGSCLELPYRLGLQFIITIFFIRIIIVKLE